MQEITTQNDFDYSIVGAETASKLKALSNQLDGIYQNYSIAVGEVLYQAQQELASFDGGTFQKWVESMGISKSNAYNYINSYRLVQNLDNPKDKEIFLNQPKSLQFEMSKPSANPELNQKVFDGDITTHKEFKELERKLKESEERNKRLEEQALQKEVIEKEVVIEKVPEDYEATKNLNSDLLNKNKHLNYDNENLQRVIKIKEHELKRLEYDSHEAIALKEAIESLRTDKEKLEGTYKNAMELSSLLSEFENFFDEKMAPLRFKAVIAGLGTEFQLKKLRDMLTLVDGWLTEMNKIIPDEGRKIIEGEIING